jgi:hypothetical protein
MFLFIDESGDPGFVGSATKYFVVCTVIFEDKKSVMEVFSGTEEFKKQKNIRRELHFVNISKRLREQFYIFAKTVNFKAKAIVINKVEITKEILIDSHNKLYNFALKLLLERLKNDTELTIILDGKGSKELQVQLRNYLKTNTNINIKKIKMEDSKTNPLLQFADMIASTIGHSYNKKDSNTDWRNLLGNKINILEYKI